MDAKAWQEEPLVWEQQGLPLPLALPLVWEQQGLPLPLALPQVWEQQGLPLPLALPLTLTFIVTLTLTLSPNPKGAFQPPLKSNQSIETPPHGGADGPVGPGEGRAR